MESRCPALGTDGLASSVVSVASQENLFRESYTATAIARISPVCHPRFLTPDESTAVLSWGKTSTPSPGRTHAEYFEARRCLNATFRQQELPDICATALHRLFDRVRKDFAYALSDTLPPEIELIRYASGDFFDWHVDVASSDGINWRKLTFSVQLSEPEDYAGGTLEFCGTDQSAASRERGTLIAFPSFCMHRVQPVTRGIRYALVGWLYGPPLT